MVNHEADLGSGAALLTSATALQLLGELAEMPEATVGGAVTATAVLPKVSALFGGTLATWNRISFVGGAHAEQVVTDPPGTWVDAAIRDVETRMDEHPLASTLGAHAGVVRLSDVISTKKWISHPVYSELLRPRGIPMYSVLVPLALKASDISFLMFNRDRDFADHELDALLVLQGGLSLLLRVPQPTDPVTLSGRECQVLQVLARGVTRTIAARELGISPTTLAKHVQNIHTKLGTHDMVSTIREAAIRGLVIFPTSESPRSDALTR